MKRLSHLLLFCCLVLTFSLSLPLLIGASGPEQAPGQEIGLISSSLACLAVGDNAPAPAAGSVHLAWQGQLQRARLALTVSGSEAPHTIKVNGQAISRVPVYPKGQPCRSGEVFYLDIPVEVLVQGENRIEITADALPGDSWSAAQASLQVFGLISPGEPAGTGQPGVAGVGAAAATEFIFSFTNSLDGTSQEATAWIPEAYNASSPAPLLIYVHGRSSSMGEARSYSPTTNIRGWLLASPELHGSWTYDEIYEIPDPPGKYAYASPESQYDIIGTIRYMVENYNVDPARIYLYGGSMGAQTGAVTVGKFPHLFAAFFDNKGPTDMAVWYGETPPSTERGWMRRECHIGGVEKTPAQNPFCYQRRSGQRFAGNFVRRFSAAQPLTSLPLSITHSVRDQLVLIHHSRDFRDAINSYAPLPPVSLFEENSGNDAIDGGPPNYHSYDPNPTDVLNFLEQFTLRNNPTSINIASDQSKSYYWLNLTQTGGDHWTQVQAAYSIVNKTVTATISDSNSLTLGFNLGSTPIVDIIPQPGLGLPAPATYLVKGGGYNTLRDYTGNGYLNINLPGGSNYPLTVSAITPQMSASPATIPAGQGGTSTITAQFRDGLGNPIPDGTPVVFTTSRGTFSNGSAAQTLPSAGGQAVAVLTPGPAGGIVTVTATVGLVAGATPIYIGVHPLYLPLIVK